MLCFAQPNCTGIITQIECEFEFESEPEFSINCAIRPVVSEASKFDGGGEWVGACRDKVLSDRSHRVHFEAAQQLAAPPSQGENHWEVFYVQHSAAFFKPRRYITAAFPQLLVERPPQHFVEIGAGEAREAWDACLTGQANGLRLIGEMVSRQALVPQSYPLWPRIQQRGPLCATSAARPWSFCSAQQVCAAADLHQLHCTI